MNDQKAYDVVIVGAGSAGIATAASLLQRNTNLSVALVDPSEDHYYQPGWTMVGAGVFDATSTHRKTKDLIPTGAIWLQNSVSTFSPADNSVTLADNTSLSYKHLVVAPGLKLDWAGVEGLEETLGKNGVTSNYRYDLAPYTWELVQQLESGKAIFTQPPMPIKCAGAPQKALYLSADHWLKQSRLDNIDIQFYNSGGVLFGVADYVPALMTYIEKYQAELMFMQTLTKVDGESKTAWFKNADGGVSSSSFDFLHVCPPQTSPDFIKASPLSDDSGWLTVNPATLQHTQYANIWGAGDVMNTANAKTMAAARKQAPVTAQNICHAIAGSSERVNYDGYGSCPLTVERGKIVLAEFAYGGKLVPTFPSWLNEGTKPSKIAWFLKASLLPWVYWNAMLKGKEWFAAPK
jgi:sulfide:quinone oxidoreductase